MEKSYCGFRIKEGDFVPWNDVLIGNDNIVKITQRTASAIGTGKIPVEAARICAQRGGNLEALVDAPPSAPSAPPAPPPPPPPAEETLPPDDAGEGTDGGEAQTEIPPQGFPGVGEPAPGDFDLI